MEWVITNWGFVGGVLAMCGTIICCAFKINGSYNANAAVTKELLDRHDEDIKKHDAHLDTHMVQLGRHDEVLHQHENASISMIVSFAT